MSNTPGENWDDEEELKALQRVVHAFESYLEEGSSEVDRWKMNYDGLPQKHKDLLSHVPDKCQKAIQALEVNQFCFKTMLHALNVKLGMNPDAKPSAFDMKKVKYVLKNMVRDWSDEAKEEREMCYNDIISELKMRFSEWEEWQTPPRVLIPGCGLARLVTEIAAIGFQAEGNEFSYFMLLPSSFLLNHTTKENAWTIHPWVLSTCNQISDDNQFRPISIPDKDPKSILGDSKGSMMMIAGDFVEVYAREEYSETFDSIVTSFFIDTAHNVVEYLEIIYEILKKGGFWINLGPLLYHWADSETDVSVEISLDDIEQIALKMGFELLSKKFLQAPYLANEKAMYQTTYKAVFWTMRKKRHDQNANQSSEDT